MPREIIIGRDGNQRFAITSDGVSCRHARLVIDDDGRMTLEDLGSRNGTFVMNSMGCFDRISRVIVSETDIIRLGSGGIHGATFWVHHLLVDNPADYNFEFRHIIKAYGEYKRQSDALWKKSDKREWVSIAAPLVGLAFSFLFRDNPLLIRMSITLPSLAVGLFFLGFAKKMRQLNGYRQRHIVCPHCGRPLSDFDIEQQQCSLCKAHS